MNRSTLTLILSAIGLAIYTKNCVTQCLNIDSIEDYYCTLSVTEPSSSFYIYAGSAQIEYGACVDFKFFDYGIDPETKKPKGCTPCPEGEHVGARNFCPSCLPCRQIVENETESLTCLVKNKYPTCYRNAQYEPSTPPNTDEPLVTEVKTTEDTVSTPSAIPNATKDPNMKLLSGLLCVVSPLLAVTLIFCGVCIRKKNKQIYNLRGSAAAGNNGAGGNGAAAGNNGAGGNGADQSAAPLMPGAEAGSIGAVGEDEADQSAAPLMLGAEAGSNGSVGEDEADQSAAPLMLGGGNNNETEESTV